MDDLILFSNVNPYDHIWKMFTDNADLVRLFKIKKTTRPEILETLPNCFQVFTYGEVCHVSQYLFDLDITWVTMAAHRLNI